MPCEMFGSDDFIVAVVDIKIMFSSSEYFQKYPEIYKSYTNLNNKTNE
jgi:hypothetical protein